MKMRFMNWDCNIVKTHYTNGRIALQLVATADDLDNDVYEGEPIAMASVNLPEVSIAADEVFIKDYSENEGMLMALVKAGIVKDTGRRVQSGFVSIPVCKIIAKELLL